MKISKRKKDDDMPRSGSWQRTFISLKRRIRTRNVEDSTLHSWDAIISNYFSISARRKERV